jgi:transposase-like protein
MLDEGTGIERRKKASRSPRERAAIVAQSCEAGQAAAGVARRHGNAPSQFSGWRREAQVRA